MGNAQSSKTVEVLQKISVIPQRSLDADHDIAGTVWCPGKKIRPRNEANFDNHTMGTSLTKYLEIKVHQAVLERRWKEIVIRGRYARYSPDSLVFEGEKRDKPFNWERPTAIADGETLYIECFPGYDHIEHYAEIIAGYLKLLKEQGQDQFTPSSAVSFIPAACSDTQAALMATNLPQFPGGQVDTVILGQVWHLPRLTGSADWSGDGPWQWIIKSFNGRQVAFLGFRPAFWGDISGEVVHYLTSNFSTVKEVVYLGKLGVLKPEVPPNQWLATGGKSLVNGRMVEWDSPLAPSVQHFSKSSIMVGTHVTLGSVLHETKSWHAQLVDEVDFVDPEIGMMAQAAVRAGIQYGYLHLITDNLGKKYDEDLSNERKQSVLSSRKRLQALVQDVLEHHLSM